MNLGQTISMRDPVTGQTTPLTVAGFVKEARYGGFEHVYVSNETASADPDHPSQATATVQLKIPVASYPATLSQLAGRLGTQLSLQEQAQDVTQQVADVNSQVASDQAAIVQLRALLSHAGSVGDLLSVQNQINNEESALEAMQAQQRALSHETSYATVTLTILGPKATPVAHRMKAPPSLAGGLGAGWHALKVSLSWTLAFLGAIAPFVTSITPPSNATPSGAISSATQKPHHRSGRNSTRLTSR